MGNHNRGGAVVSELIDADSDELTIQIIENDKRLAALREYAQMAWNLNPKLESLLSLKNPYKFLN